MEGFADIEGPVMIGIWPLVLMIAGGALLVLLGILLILWILKRPKAEKPARQEQRRSPLELAMERLQRLKSEKSTLEPEPFTVEVSDIVRDYLEEALEIPAREQTSEEFLNALSTRNDMPDVLHRKMPAFLESCDRVKFARQSLDTDQQDSLLETAQDVVESTDTELSVRTTEKEPEATAV